MSESAAWSEGFVGLPYLFRSYPIFERAGMEEGRDPGVGGGRDAEFTALELPPPPPLPTGGDFQPAVAPGFKDEHPGGPSSDAGGRGYQEIMPKTAYRLPERDTQVALRPGFGRNGRPVALYANHFAVKLLNSEDFYHYNASCLPSFFSFFLAFFVQHNLHHWLFSTLSSSYCIASSLLGDRQFL